MDPMSEATPTNTQDVYERRAADYDAQRSRAFFEARWLSRFADSLPEGGRVLDVGCGGGEPIAGWLIREGYQVTGTDFSEAMLEIARGRFPDGDWRLSDMRALDLEDRFHGIIGWDSFFHLTPDEQRETIPRLARHLLPDGVLMITVGPIAGEVTGTVGGEIVYHASLSVGEYAQVMDDAGLRLIAYMAEDPYCDFHTVAMARKLDTSDTP